MFRVSSWPGRAFGKVTENCGNFAWLEGYLRNYYMIPVLIATVVLAGCGGDAQIEVRNHTSRYIDGDIEGDSYGVNPNGAITRDVEVGSFFRRSSKVDVLARYHRNSDSFSPVEFEKTFRNRYEADGEYVLELYVTSEGVNAVRMIGTEPQGGVTAP